MSPAAALEESLDRDEDLVWMGVCGEAEDLDLNAGQGDWEFAVMVWVQPILCGLRHVCPLCKSGPSPSSKVLFN